MYTWFFFPLLVGVCVHECVFVLLELNNKWQSAEMSTSDLLAKLIYLSMIFSLHILHKLFHFISVEKNLIFPHIRTISRIWKHSKLYNLDSITKFTQSVENKIQILILLNLWSLFLEIGGRRDKDKYYLVLIKLW